MKTSFGISTLSVVTIVSLVVAIGCDDDDGITIDGKGITVTGTVTDSISGQPLDSVLVSWGDTLVQELGAFSDSLGRYMLSAPVYGRIIWARKDGYASKGREIVGVNPDLTLTNFDFELKAQ